MMTHLLVERKTNFVIEHGTYRHCYVLTYILERSYFTFKISIQGNNFTS